MRDPFTTSLALQEQKGNMTRELERRAPRFDADDVEPDPQPTRKAAPVREWTDREKVWGAFAIIALTALGRPPDG